MSFDAFLYGICGKLRQTDRTDDAPGISARDHVNRCGSGNDHGIIKGFVTVPIYQCDITGQYLTAPDDLIYGTGTIQHIIGQICAENPGGIPFCVTGSSFMIQQRSQFRNRNGKVAAECIFSEKLEHCHAGRSPEKAQSAQMPGSMPGIFVTFGIGHQFSKKFRQNIFRILFDPISDSAGDKFDCICGFPQTVTDLAQDLSGKFFSFQVICQQDDRNFGVPHPDP